MSEPQIYIRGFPKSTNEKDLERHFQKIGTIKQVRIINAYAFIGFQNGDHAKEAVKQFNGQDFDGYKLRVEIAGEAKKNRGPQPNDECRNCGRLGHWRNSCPERRRDRRDRRRRERSRNRSSSSQSSSSSEDRKKKKKKSSKKRRKYSSSSQSSYSSSSSRSSSSSKQGYDQKQRQREKSSKKKRKHSEKEEQRK